MKTQTTFPVTRKQLVIIEKREKSIVLAILFSLVLGPIGITYSSLPGSVIMFMCCLISLQFISGTGLITVWSLGIIWSVIATILYNKKQRLEYHKKLTSV